MKNIGFIMGGSFKKIICLFVFLSVFALHATESYQDYVCEIQATFAQKMHRELGLHSHGFSGTMREKVEEFGMDFLADRRATIEEARALELYVIDQLVQAINAHEKIQPYLDIQPFSFKRVTIGITFQGNNGMYADGSVYRVSSVSDLALTDLKNHIIYRAEDPFRYTSIELLKEPYEEALRLNSDASVELTHHQSNEYEEEMDKLFASVCNELEKQYALDCWSIGGDLKDGIKEIGATFKLHQPIIKEETRQLLIAVSEKLLNRLNNNDKLRPYLKEYPFPSSALKINLAFNSNHYYTFSDVRISSIKLKENKIAYEQKIFHPPEDGYGEITETREAGVESYDEALRIVKEHPQEFSPKSPSLWVRLKEWWLGLIFKMYLYLLF